MVFKVVGGPFDGIPLDGRPPGYEFVVGAEEPTLQWRTAVSHARTAGR